MDFIRRVCIVMGLFTAVLLVPSRVLAVKIDPYAFTTVIGTVFFEYEHDSRTEQETGFVDKTSDFRQNYSLLMRGHLLSRVLATYDASVTFERQTFNTTTAKNSTNSFYFDISTTLLPLSRIPLTLFGSRTANSSSSDQLQNNHNTTDTTVGLNWTGKFRVLPVMNLNVTRNVQDAGNNQKNKDTRIYFTADKEYGPTVNNFRYTGTFREDTTGSSDSTTNLGLSNVTRLSRHSTLSVGLTRDVSDTVNSGTERTFGLTMTLASQPSRFFDQTHNLTHFRTDAQDESFNGTSYAGNLRYRISRRVSSNLSLGVSKVFTETPTSSQDSTSTNAAGNLSYKITKHLYTTQTVSFSFTETNASNSLQRNLSDRKIFNSLSSLNYNRDILHRLNFFGSYGLGYLYDTDINLDQPDNGGQALTHQGEVTLSRIDFNRFFFFDTGYSFRRVLKTTSGTVNEKVNRYRAHAYNRFWKKYLIIDATFEKFSHKTAVEAIEEKGETTSLTITTTPVKGGRVAFNLQRNLFFDDFAGFSHTNSGEITAGYGHKLLGGIASGNIHYRIFDRAFNGGSDITRTTSYELNYERVLVRRVMWKFNAQRTDSRIEEFFSRYTVLTNTAFYRLRAWTFSLQHVYTRQEDSTREERENKILLKAARQFIRIF